MSVAQIGDCLCAFEEPQTGKPSGPFLSCDGSFVHIREKRVVRTCFCISTAKAKTCKSSNPWSALNARIVHRFDVRTTEEFCMNSVMVPGGQCACAC